MDKVLQAGALVKAGLWVSKTEAGDFNLVTVLADSHQRGGWLDVAVEKVPQMGVLVKTGLWVSETEASDLTGSPSIQEICGEQSESDATGVQTATYQLISKR